MSGVPPHVGQGSILISTFKVMTQTRKGRACWAERDELAAQRGYLTLNGDPGHWAMLLKRNELRTIWVPPQISLDEAKPAADGVRGSYEMLPVKSVSGRAGLRDNVQPVPIAEKSGLSRRQVPEWEMDNWCRKRNGAGSCQRRKEL